MKLDEIIHRKRQASGAVGHLGSRFPRHDLEEDFQRIFKWQATLSSARVPAPQRAWILDIVVPGGTEADDFNFAIGMINRKLPVLVKKHLGDDLQISEPMPIYPQMKALPGQKLERSTVPPKVRVSIK